MRNPQARPDFQVAASDRILDKAIAHLLDFAVQISLTPAYADGGAFAIGRLQEELRLEGEVATAFAIGLRSAA